MSYTSVKIYLKKKFPRVWEIIKQSGLSKLIQGTVTVLIPIDSELVALKNLLDRDQYGPLTVKLKHYIIRGQYSSGSDFKSKMAPATPAVNACGTAFLVTKIDNNDVEFDSGKMSLDTNYSIANSCGYENRSAIWIIKSGAPNENTQKIEYARPIANQQSTTSTVSDKKTTSKKKGSSESYKSLTDWRTWLMRLHYSNTGNYASQLMHTFQYMIHRLQRDHSDLYVLFVNMACGILEVDCMTLLYTPSLFASEIINTMIQEQQQDSSINYKKHEEFMHEYVKLCTDKKSVCNNLLSHDPKKLHEQVIAYVGEHCTESAGMGIIEKYDELFTHIADSNTIPNYTDKIYDDKVISMLHGKGDLLKIHSEIIYIMKSLMENNHGSKSFVLGIFLETFGSISNNTKSTTEMNDVFLSSSDRCNYIRTMVCELYNPISEDVLLTLNKKYTMNS